MLFLYFLMIFIINNCQSQFFNPIEGAAPLSPFWQSEPIVPPFGFPFRRRWRRPIWGTPWTPFIPDVEEFPQNVPELTVPITKNDREQLNYHIDKVVISVNEHTSAFKKTGQSYEKVIETMASYLNRRSNSKFNIKTPLPYTGLSHSEEANNNKIATAMFENDMVLTLPQMQKVASDGFRIRRKMSLNGTSWGKTIPYKFLDSDTSWQEPILRTLRYFEKHTCIRFMPNNLSTDHLLFNRGEGCYSSVGRLGGAQEISIGDGCGELGIIAHEIGHALGFWHEQSRPERDSYVRVNAGNVVVGLEGQFDKRASNEVNEYSIPYDYGSIMHYSSRSFSRSWNLNTVETLDKAFMNTIGNRIEPSFLDIKLLNKAFCADKCTNQLNCLHGGYPDPNNCSICKCPTGLEGTICDRLQVSSCGTELPRAETKWRNISYSGTSDCFWRVTAPSGMRIRYELTHVQYKCDPVCNEFVEIKDGINHEITGFRQCCKADVPERVSKINSIIIISKATQRSQFVLKYRLVGSQAPVISRTWSEWSSCSERCGSCGTQFRRRCTREANCSQPEKQFKVCNNKPCASGTTRGDTSILGNRHRREGEWCCARFILSNGVCVPVRTG